MKVFNWIFGILFVVFAALQFNDPDPYVWIPIYLFGAITCFLAARQSFHPKLYLLGIAIYLGYAGYLFFAKDGMLDWLREHNAENISSTMKATKPWIEATREFFGLMILIAVLVVNYVAGRRKNTSNNFLTTEHTGKTQRTQRSRQI